MTDATIIQDERLAALYRYWQGKRRGAVLPARADLDPVEIPVAIWPHLMLLDVIAQDGAPPRFRYRRVGEVFWNALGHDPTGRFLSEALPATAGYRDYVLGIYREVVERRLPLYTENVFTLDGQALPMLTKRVSVPLSKDGGAVDMLMTGHVFEYGELSREQAFSLVTTLKEGARVVLEG